MTIICCYCKTKIGEKDGQGQTGVSHGICPHCMDTIVKEQLTQMRKRKPELMELMAS